MPKHTSGVRGGSTKRRDIASDENRDQELRSANSVDLSHRSTEGPRNPAAVLASSNGALQRLAGIAQYFESSFNQDIDALEGAYGTEMDRDNEIRKLSEALETLTYFKSEELENLRHENRELKAGQEDCDQERKRCQTMQAELEAQHAKAETDREEEYKRKWQDEKAKFKKQMKVMKAEFEAESEGKVRELENENEKLSATNERLNQRLSAVEEKLEAKKTRHARVEKSLEDDNKRLTVELKQVKSDFPVEGQPVQYYVEKFRHISDAVKAVSAKYFQKLPERAMVVGEDPRVFNLIAPSLSAGHGIQYPEAVQQELSKLNTIFDSTPISQTEISEFLRLSDVQHVISTCLYDFVWQPFFPLITLPNPDVVCRFLEAVSKSLSASGGRTESAWRVLTLRGIDDLSVESSGVESAIHRVLEILRPLTIPSELAELEKDLFDITKQSITLWKVAQKDEARFVVEKYPDSSDKENWHAEDIHVLKEAPMPRDETIDTAGIKPLCLFPNIRYISPRGETVIVHEGTTLLPNSHVWIQGMLEKKQHEEELAKAVLDARSKVNARRTSFATGPNSPTRERFSMTQT